MLAVYAGGDREARRATRDGGGGRGRGRLPGEHHDHGPREEGPRVVPVASIEEPASFAGADYRVGERGSAKVKGFDFGNSPTEIAARGSRPAPPSS